MASMLRRILDTLSVTAIRHRLDRRRLQQEMDLHRLYMLTTYYSRHLQAIGPGGGVGAMEEALADELSNQAQSMGLECTQAAVQVNLSTQLLTICHTLHTLLEAAGDGAAALRQMNERHTQPHPPPQPFGLGTDFRVHSPKPAPPPSHPKVAPTSVTLSPLAVSQAFMAAHGFSLRVEPSACRQPEAGNGVWLQGSAALGQIVGLYPGVAYPPLHHRDIPGYPLVARTNSYLYARYDGTVLDGKPWGHGEVDGEEVGNRAAGPGWRAGAHNVAESTLSKLEGRHPLALAHMANHPPPGVTPNVMLASVDFLVDHAALRPYFPVISYADVSRSTYVKDGEEGTPASVATQRSSVPGAALVALRPLDNEELWLNYRLNPNSPGGLPEWYASCDGEEDARRWA